MQPCTSATVINKKQIKTNSKLTQKNNKGNLAVINKTETNNNKNNKLNKKHTSQRINE